jgi:hypothetical protein
LRGSVKTDGGMMECVQDYIGPLLLFGCAAKKKIADLEVTNRSF